MCKCYKCNQTYSIDIARYRLFSKSVTPEALPPASDALRFHVMRVHYQSMIWRQADCAIPEFPDDTQFMPHAVQDFALQMS